MTRPATIRAFFAGFLGFVVAAAVILPAVLPAATAQTGSAPRFVDDDEHVEIHPTPAASADAAPPELAAFMGALQQFSAKLGYSIEGRNQKLAAFYLTELHETLGEIMTEVPEHDGLPVAKEIPIIMFPAMNEVTHRVDTEDWAAAGKAYVTLIESCNRCHTAMQHEFITITPATGEPVFNQKFTAP